MRMICLTLTPLAFTALAVNAQPLAADSLDALTRQQDYEARRASSSHEDITRNGDARGIDKGETLVLMEEEGPGVVTHIWHTIGSYDLFHGRSLVLRVYYDGNELPSVQSPLGDFFGIGHAAWRNLTSLPVTVTSHGRSRSCYWRMPFRDSIKITVTNDSEMHDVDSFYYYVDWQKHERLPEDTAYFHARYRQEFPARPGNYTILDTRGRGHYVGTVYSAHQMESGWFGEGDDFFYIDGAEAPQLRGTGTEDYFNDAWGFREFCAPYFGVPIYEGVLTGDRVTAYRWHIPDPVPFRESLRVVIEHRGSVFNDRASLANFELGNFEERSDWLSSVAFWYQYPPAHVDEPLPPAAERVAPYRMIKGSDLTYRADPPFLVMAMDPFLAYIPGVADAKIEFDLEIPEDGRYQISGVFLYGIPCGVYQPYLDDKPVGGPRDFVMGQYDPYWTSLDTHDLKAGTHTLRFEGTGKPSPNARVLLPNMNGLGVAALVLLRLDDMEGYVAVRDRLLEEKK
ncbi:MAG TPA: DUF2961 domain-containing protein [Candidatus Hydrogenedentes bacterium]|nr:DUF2961 domain-containing protein [Candidatus Hydrogenedentota bacterium]HNT86572.1 DUF2961 domain-containing protein [Candidatus Hydrogenedentota bacterium]